MKLTDGHIKHIIYQMASDSPDGSLYGHDTDLGHIDDMIRLIRDIIEHPEKYKVKTHKFSKQSEE